MTSHDLPIEEIRRLLEADRQRTHVHVYDHLYIGPTGYQTWSYCKCGKWKE